MCGESLLRPTLICPPPFVWLLILSQLVSLALSLSLSHLFPRLFFFSFFFLLACLTFPLPLFSCCSFFFSSLCVLYFHLSLHFSLSSFCLSLVNHSSLASSCWAQTSRSLYYTDDRYTTHKTARARAHACTHRGPTASSQRQCRVVAGSDLLTFSFFLFLSNHWRGVAD